MQKKLSSRKFYIHEYAEKRCMEDYAKEQLELGEARGEIRGRNEGIKQTTLELAKKMVQKGTDYSYISEITGLPIQLIKSLI